MKTLTFLYIGDIMGKPGRQVVAKVLPQLRRTHQFDVVMAQAENVSHGKSMSTHHMRELQRLGIDFFTGGNHTIERPSIVPLLADPGEPVVAPLNQEGVEPAWGVKTWSTRVGRLQIISLLGTTFPEAVAVRNPLRAIDSVLEATAHESLVARIVNFHGDLSSEKRIIGYYLDGRVSAVIGDHWHVPTADAMVLPDGTAHITDVGMCGTIHSSLGVTKEIIIKRWRDNAAGRNEITEEGPYQFNAAAVTVDITTGRALTITPIQKVLAAL